MGLSGTGWRGLASLGLALALVLSAASGAGSAAELPAKLEPRWIVPRPPGSLAASVAGIGVIFAELGDPDKLSGARATGYFVGRCRLVTAAHALQQPGKVIRQIFVGFGPPAPGTEGLPLNSQGRFSTVVEARLTYVGAYWRAKDVDVELNEEIEALSREQWGRTVGGDWAILELTDCAKGPTAVFSLPKPPFTAGVDDFFANAPMTALGYPNGEFDSLKASRCYLQYASPLQLLHFDRCNVTHGNSGGPVVGELADGRFEPHVLGTLSFGDGDQVSMIFAKAASAASTYPARPASPDCMTRLKAQLKALGFPGLKPGPPGQLSAEESYELQREGRLLAEATDAIPAGIVPMQPDAFFCETLTAYGAGEKAVGSPALDAIAGLWRHEDREAGLGCFRLGRRSESLGFEPLSSDDKTRYSSGVILGRRILIRTASPRPWRPKELVYGTYVIDLVGEAPTLTATTWDGKPYPVFAKLVRC
jgi:hypothetical protein